MPQPAQGCWLQQELHEKTALFMGLLRLAAALRPAWAPVFPATLPYTEPSCERHSCQSSRLIKCGQWGPLPLHFKCDNGCE